MTAATVYISGRGRDVDQGVLAALIVGLLALAGTVWTAVSGRTPYAALADRVIKLEEQLTRVQGELHTERTLAATERAAAHRAAAEAAAEVGGLRKDNSILRAHVMTLEGYIREKGHDVPAVERPL